MTTENNEQTNGNEETNNQPENNEQQTEEKLIDEIAGKQAQIRQAVAQGKTSNDNEQENQEEQGEEIDETLVEAARSVGMTDEEIINMATDNPKALETLAIVVKKSGDSEASTPEKGEMGDNVENKPDKKSDEIDEKIDLDNLDPEVAKVVKPLLKQIAALEEKVTKSNQKDEEQRIEKVQIAINQDFDGMTEAYPVLGNTETMTEAQFRLRESVLEEALVISSLPSTKRNNTTWPDCLKQAAMSLLGNPKPGSEKNNLEKKSAKDVKKLYTQKPSGRKRTDKNEKNADGTKSEAELADNIAAIQASVRTGRNG